MLYYKNTKLKRRRRYTGGKANKYIVWAIKALVISKPIAG